MPLDPGNSHDGGSSILIGGGVVGALMALATLVWRAVCIGKSLGEVLSRLEQIAANVQDQAAAQKVETRRRRAMRKHIDRARGSVGSKPRRGAASWVIAVAPNSCTCGCGA